LNRLINFECEAVKVLKLFPLSDPTTEIRKRSGLKQTASSCSSALPKKHSFAQFLEFDRRVLKFQGYWNDRSEFGDVRKLEICYYQKTSRHRWRIWLGHRTLEISGTIPEFPPVDGSLRLIELVVEVHQPDQLTPDLFLHKRHRKCTTRNKL